MDATHIYLASNSPRRHELLDQIGVRYRLIAAEVDETRLADESAEAMVSRLALAKARAGRRAVIDAGLPPLPVLGADTVVVVDEQLLGKPRDRADGLAMLARLSGRCHRVLTAVALVHDDGEAQVLSDNKVCFRGLSASEAAAYWASGEPADKAGAYAIQGLAAQFITRLEGSFSAVVGLPLCETATLLNGCGIFPMRGGECDK